MNAPTSSNSGCQFLQAKVDQRPVYDPKRGFRRKLKRGRPAKNDPRQYWLK